MLLKVFYNSVIISLPKNSLQYLLGTLLFFLVFGSINLILAVIGLVGFLLAYSSVYLYNDLMDVKEDRADKDKRGWKIVASGELSEGRAKFMAVVFLLLGLGISFTVSVLFMALVLFVLSLNLLHSSPYTRFKKSMGKAAMNMIAIEFLKFSSGWFALGSALAVFPFWIFLLFSLAYVISYIVYKFKLRGKDIKRNKWLFIVLGFVSVISYIAAFLCCGFPLPMVLTLVLSGVAVGLMKFMGWGGKRMGSMFIMEYILLFLVFISFLVMLIPGVAGFNGSLASLITSFV